MGKMEETLNGVQAFKKERCPCTFKEITSRQTNNPFGNGWFFTFDILAVNTPTG